MIFIIKLMPFYQEFLKNKLINFLVIVITPGKEVATPSPTIFAIVTSNPRTFRITNSTAATNVNTTEIGKKAIYNTIYAPYLSKNVLRPNILKPNILFPIICFYFYFYLV